MRIRMKTLSAGPAGTREQGKEYDVPDAEGEQLVRGHHAERVGPSPRPAVESAAVEPADEASMLPGPKPRKLK